MLAVDYDVQNFTRRCHLTGREFAPGDWYFSVLTVEGAETRRADYSPEAWKGPPENAVGWWKSQVPGTAARKRHHAPNEVMLQLFDELADRPERQDMRYVLTLLLIRRRVFRLEEECRDAEGREVLAVHCPRRDADYRVPVALPDHDRTEQIQQELAALFA